MKHGIFALLLLLLVAGTAAAKEQVLIETSKGTVRIELNGEKAPTTVKNFLDYVDAGFYDGTIFHRVIKDFMVQGGGFTGELQQKPTRSPIRNEAANGLKNERGTIAMARTNVVDSATSQFFINLKDNPFLDHRGPSSFGYAVFGRVVEGMEVIDAIGSVRTGRQGPYSDVPQEAVVIKSVRRVKP